MRQRPMTPTEMNAIGQSTPASQAVFARAFGGTARIMQTRRRRKKKRVVQRVQRKKSRRVKAPRGRAHLVRGSAAAKRHMARLRNLPRRSRRVAGKA